VAEYSEENNTNVITMRIPDMTIFTDTDKEAYKIRQKVYITSTITNLTSATTYSNLLLITSAKDSTSKEVYSKTLSLGSIAPSSSSSNNEIWSTAGLAVDGAYTISQKVYAGTQLAAENSRQVMFEKAPDFTLTTDNISRRIKQGEQATYISQVNPFNGWNHEVTFSMEGLPSEASASFSPAGAVPPAQFEATVNTSSLTPAGSHTLYLTGQGTDEGEIVTRTAQLTLDVSAFNIESTASNATVKQLEQAVFPITIGSLNGYEGSVNLTITDLPNGTRASFDTATAQAPGEAI
jgi:hypothetical protein